MRDYSRRSFLTGAATAAIAAGSMSLVGCSGNDTKDSAHSISSIEWDREEDVVVVGSGAAGLSAAIEALQTGSSAVVYESQPMTGGSTALNGGLIAGHGTRLAKELGVEVTTEEVLAWFEESEEAQTLLSGEPEPDILQIVGERGGETIDWLEDNGVVFQEMVGVEEDYSPLPVFHYTGSGGAFTAPLIEKVEELGGEVISNARVSKLYQDEEGRVVGIKIDKDNTNIKANKAVVLATGGYASNPAMLEHLVPAFSNVYSNATPGAQGDGLVMANEIQAVTRRTSNQPTLIPALELNSNLIFNWYCLEDGGIAVDSKAQRFVDEGLDYVTGEVIREILAHFRETSDENFWMIVNEGERTKQSLEIYPMDVARADSIEELASMVDLDPKILKESVDKWNAIVDSDADTEFGRTAMMHKIDTPPYVGVKVRPSASMTVGGVHIDSEAHVLKWGTVGSEQIVENIPGLFAAGEVTGWNARGGWTVNACFTMGRIAGQNAAKEEPWS